MNLPINGHWFSFSDKMLLKMNAEGNADSAESLREGYRQYSMNRLSYFLAHGRPTEDGNAGIDFLNDYTSDFCCYQKPNRVGGSYHSIAWLALRLCKCDPSWPCFSGVGDWKLKVPEFRGPGIPAAACSYQKRHIINSVWSAILEIFPEYELKEYSPHWHSKTGKKVRGMNWNSGAPTIKLDCGNNLDLYWYSSGMVAFASTKYAYAVVDEQIPLGPLHELQKTGREFGGIKIASGVTPHKVDGLPETGAAGWLYKAKMGTDTQGMKVTFYRCAISDAPDHIYAKSEKIKAKKQYIDEPKRTGNRKAQREGMSRYEGTFEVASGMVYDGWDPKVQWIDPFPAKVMAECKSRWTMVRAMDHGRTSPFAALWGMLSPWGDLVLYRAYYEPGDMGDHVAKVLALSGNKRRQIGEKKDDKAGATYKIYTEDFCGEKYLFSVMDGRTFAQPGRDVATPLGVQYNQMGLQCTPASGMNNEKAVPIVAKWFEQREDRKHILVNLKLKDKIVVDGMEITKAPRLYVFNTLRPFRSEIEDYVNDDKKDRPATGQADHLMDCAKYMILANPRFMAVRQEEIERMNRFKPRSKVTGY